MSIDMVRTYLKSFGKEQEIIELDASSATVELAAQALHTEPERIAKTLSFMGKEHALVVVCCGNSKIDNHKYKQTFGVKAKMLKAEEVERHTNHKIGGVCPFALPKETEVYLDISLKRYETIYPACGSANSAIRLTWQELEALLPSAIWVDVCK